MKVTVVLTVEIPDDDSVWEDVRVESELPATFDRSSEILKFAVAGEFLKRVTHGRTEMTITRAPRTAVTA